MGFCFSRCVSNQINDISNGVIKSSYLMGEGPLPIKTLSVLEDCPFFYEEEIWYSTIAELNGASFFDTNKFLDLYPNYKKDQVKKKIQMMNCCVLC